MHRAEGEALLQLLFTTLHQIHFEVLSGTGCCIIEKWADETCTEWVFVSWPTWRGCGAIRFTLACSFKRTLLIGAGTLSRPLKYDVCVRRHVSGFTKPVIFLDLRSQYGSKIIYTACSITAKEGDCISFWLQSFDTFIPLSQQSMLVRPRKWKCLGLASAQLHLRFFTDHSVPVVPHPDCSKTVIKLSLKSSHHSDRIAGGLCTINVPSLLEISGRQTSSRGNLFITRCCQHHRCLPS